MNRLLAQYTVGLRGLSAYILEPEVPRGWQRNFPLGGLQVQAAVHVAAVANDCHGDNAGLVVYRIDDPVVTGSYPEKPRMALKGFNTCGPGIGGECAHFSQHIIAGLVVELTEGPADARACLNGVGGHGVSLQLNLRLSLGLGFCLSLGLGLSLGLSFSLKLLKRDRGAGFVHRGLGLGDIQCVLSGAERVEHGLGNDSGYPLTVDGEMSDDAMAG